MYLTGGTFLLPCLQGTLDKVFCGNVRRAFHNINISQLETICVMQGTEF